MRAANNGHSGVVKVLIDAGAAIEAKDNVSRWIYYNYGKYYIKHYYQYHTM